MNAREQFLQQVESLDVRSSCKYLKDVLDSPPNGTEFSPFGFDRASTMAFVRAMDELIAMMLSCECQGIEELPALSNIHSIAGAGLQMTPELRIILQKLDQIRDRLDYYASIDVHHQEADEIDEILDSWLGDEEYRPRLTVKNLHRLSHHVIRHYPHYETEWKKHMEPVFHSLQGNTLRKGVHKYELRAVLEKIVDKTMKDLKLKKECLHHNLESGMELALRPKNH